MMQVFTGQRWVIVGLVFVGGLCLAAARADAQAPATDSQLQAELVRQIAKLTRDTARITVSVEDHTATLDGTLPTLALKRQIIDRARKTRGITRVAATLEIARAESDAQLAAAVAHQLQTYPRFTIYDAIEGRVRDGVVTLSGAVTTPNKPDEITARLEQIRGVQDIQNQLRVLPVSPTDDRIRTTIATQIYRDPLFVNYSRVNPPIHILVENGHVTLLGFVSSRVERQKAEAVAHFVPGVFSVDNQIHLTSDRGTP